MFVDPAQGDFRVKDGSPAFNIGFRNFAMDQFGVKKPSLRSKAGKPVISRLRQKDSTVAIPPKADSGKWLGASLHSL